VTGLAEVALQKGARLAPQVRPSLDAEAVHLGGCHWAHPMEFRHRQGRNESLAFVRPYNELSVGLTMV
jgi:hypothetical protein